MSGEGCDEPQPARHRLLLGLEGAGEQVAGAPRPLHSGVQGAGQSLRHQPCVPLEGGDGDGGRGVQQGLSLLRPGGRQVGQRERRQTSKLVFNFGIFDKHIYLLIFMISNIILFNL